LSEEWDGSWALGVAIATHIFGLHMVDIQWSKEMTTRDHVIESYVASFYE